MTRKLTIATVAFFCLLGGIAYSAGTADARPIHDGQNCAHSALRSTWRMAPDECHWVTPMGGFMWLSKACTEVDVWMYGKRLRQKRYPKGYGFGFNAFEGQPMIAFRPSDGFFVNGDRAPVKVFCWHS